MPRNRRNLVVDADIVRSAGTVQATHPRSSLCRSVLESIRTAGHSVVLSDALYAEWRRHMSGYSATWLGNMQSASRVVRLKDDELPDLSSLLSHCACGNAQDRRVQVMSKDIHLVETALAERAGKAVVSADGVVRRYLLVHVRCDSRIGVVVWVNPEIEDHGCLDWLRAGAKLERARQLRRQADLEMT
ncbi:MAG: hypothetical protein U0893_03060 [Chloroflexota bacterium]